MDREQWTVNSEQLIPVNSEQWTVNSYLGVEVFVVVIVGATFPTVLGGRGRAG